jgi:hypothetical protein
MFQAGTDHEVINSTNKLYNEAFDLMHDPE